MASVVPRSNSFIRSVIALYLTFVLHVQPVHRDGEESGSANSASDERPLSPSESPSPRDSPPLSFDSAFPAHRCRQVRARPLPASQHHCAPQLHLPRVTVPSPCGAST